LKRHNAKFHYMAVLRTWVGKSISRSVSRLNEYPSPFFASKCDIKHHTFPRWYFLCMKRLRAFPYSMSCAADLGGFSLLRCSACGGIEFSDLEDQKDHFKTDWHVYNTKRKVRPSLKAAYNSNFRFIVTLSHVLYI
jgi:hypothetical protein